MNLNHKGLFGTSDFRGMYNLHKAQYYPSFFNQVCQEIYDLGFRRIHVSRTFQDKADVRFTVPTILFIPTFNFSSSILRTKHLLYENWCKTNYSAYSNKLREFLEYVIISSPFE
jgi:hypothetical protein